MRKLIYYVAGSVDGFIAGPAGEVDFYPFEPDLAEFIQTEYPETFPTAFRQEDVPHRVFDTVLMGRGTYQPALDLGVAEPYAHLRQIVFSRTVTGPGVTDEDPVAVVRRLKQEPGRDLWLCGGGQLAGRLLDEIDEWVIKLSPVLVGSGIPLVQHGFDPRRLTLIDATPLKSGVVVLRYTGSAPVEQP